MADDLLRNVVFILGSLYTELIPGGTTFIRETGHFARSELEGSQPIHCHLFNTRIF